MQTFTIRISNETNDALEAWTKRHPTAKSKSELIRTILDDVVARGAENTRAPTREGAAILRILESVLFAELALQEFLEKKVGRAGELLEEARTAAARFRRTPP